MSKLKLAEKLRVALVIAENDYLNSAQAVEDAHRVAVLASGRKLRRDRESLRVSTSNELNLRRNPAAKRVRGASRGADVATLVALLLVIITIALAVGANRRSGVPLVDAGTWTLPLGALYLAAIALFAWCEPLRARNEVWYTGWPRTGYLLFAAFGFIAVGVIIGLRWKYLWPEQIPFVVAGLACFVAAGVWALWLWRGARGSDQLDLNPDRRLPTRGLIDLADSDEFNRVMDAWWVEEGARLATREPAKFEALFAETLGELTSKNLLNGPGQLRSRDVQFPPKAWQERRPKT